MSPLNGVLPVDKPAGPTSHDIVARARRSLGIRRIGHTGTLDPFASGLLILCVGPATRLAEYLTALPKSYKATLRLGTTTTTHDLEGEVVRTDDAWRGVDESHVLEALNRQVGELMQLPPAYSAKKVDGERAYERARRGEEVEVEPVRVTVTRIELTRFKAPDVEFEVDCSSGTYIRAIARDVGEDLEVGAHLVALRRTHIGGFDVTDAIGLDELDDRDTAGAAVHPPADAVAHLPLVVVADDEIPTIRTGRFIEREIHESKTPIALITSTGELAAIGEAGDHRIHPRKVFL